MSWDDVEELARRKGMSLQDAAQSLGINLENKLNTSIQALKKLGTAAPTKRPDDPSRFMKSAPLPPNDRNDATLASQSQYEQTLNNKFKQNAEDQLLQDQQMNALEDSNPDDESGYTDYKAGTLRGGYAQGGTVQAQDYNPLLAPQDTADNAPMKSDRFKRIDKMMKSSGKATAEKEASKNPEKFLKDNKNMSIKGRKGVAF